MVIKAKAEFKRILDLMKENKIPFIILRNYDFLSDLNREVPSEIDILAPNSAISQIETFFFNEMYYKMVSPGHIGFRNFKERFINAFDFHILI